MLFEALPCLDRDQDRLLDFNAVIAVTAFTILGTIGMLVVPIVSRNGSELLSGLTYRLVRIVDPTTNSTVGRLDVWRMVLQVWRHNIWLGSGLLSFKIYSAVDSGWVYNFVLQTLNDSGILGTFFLFWICTAIFLFTLKAYRLATDPRDREILLGYLAAQVALYFVSLFSSFVWSAFAWVLWGLSVGHSLLIVRGLSRKSIGERV